MTEERKTRKVYFCIDTRKVGRGGLFYIWNGRVATPMFRFESEDKTTYGPMERYSFYPRKEFIKLFREKIEEDFRKNRQEYEIVLSAGVDIMFHSNDELSSFEFLNNNLLLDMKDIIREYNERARNQGENKT